MILFYMFKSYYVVWKHMEDKKKEDKYFLFKSYYVVWKLVLKTHNIF